jgi:two-component system, LuxR family, sensor kinase FixL
VVFIIALAAISGVCFATGGISLLYGAARRSMTDFGSYSVMSLTMAIVAAAGIFAFISPAAWVHGLAIRASCLASIPFWCSFLHVFHVICRRRANWFDKGLVAISTVVYLVAAFNPSGIWVNGSFSVRPASDIHSEQVWLADFAPNMWLVSLVFAMHWLFTLRAIHLAWTFMKQNRLTAVILLTFSGSLFITLFLHFGVTAGTLEGPPIAPFAFVSAFVLLGVEIFRRDRKLLDDTERSIEALLRSEARFRLFFDNSPDGVLIARLDGAIVAANPAMSLIHGYQHDELLGRGTVELVHPEDRASFCRSISSISEESVCYEETRHVHRDGSTIHVDVYAQLMPTMSGESHMLVFVRDVTVKQLALDRLDEQQAVLRHASRLSTMGEMLAGVAHELNQPLAAISNYSAACQATLRDDKGTEFADWLQRINQQALHCGEIIRRMRGFVKKADADPDWVDLNQIVRDSIQLVQCDRRWDGVSINSSLPTQSLRVQGTEVQLQQVIVNLLRNACEATCDETSPEIHVRLDAKDNKACLTVRDNGPGVDAEAQARLFDTFFTTKQDGLGIGLGISKSIIEAHAGHLRLDSTTGPGATFRIDLPMCANERALAG